MSKILVVKSLPEDTTGLLFLDRSDSHASIVELGEGVSLDNGVLSASGGGGGGGSVETLTDVTLGGMFQLTAGDVLNLSQIDPSIWINVPMSTLVIGYVPTALINLPGVEEGFILKIVGGTPTWVAPT